MKVSKKPWHDGVENGSAESEKLWKKVKPKDFLYHVGVAEGENLLSITPKEFFEENDCCYDQELAIPQLEAIGEEFDLEQLAEGMFSFSGPAEVFDKRLSKIGFLKSDEFSKFISEVDSSDPEYVEDVNVSKPEELLHYITYSNSSVMVVFAPEEFFNKNNHLYDGKIWIPAFTELEKDFGMVEVSKGMFEFSTSVPVMSNKLKEMGFKQSDSFKDFIDILVGVKKDTSGESPKMALLDEALSKIELDKSRLKDPEYKEIYFQQVYATVERVMELKISDITSLITSFVSENAEKLANQVNYIAEHDDFANFHDSKPKMAEAIRRGATTLDSWKLHAVDCVKNVDHHISFVFGCDFLNGGEDFQGVVILDDFGKVKHSFVHAKMSR